MSERLHRDVFPAEVFIPRSQGRHLGARAFVTSHRIIVWKLDADGQPETVFEEALTAPAPERDRGTQGAIGTLETAAGPVFVSYDEGCGCGSALKYMAPPVGW